MSSLIKSSRVTLENSHYKLKSNITLPKSQLFNKEVEIDNSSDINIESIINEAKDKATKIIIEAQFEAERILDNSKMESLRIETEATDKSNAVYESARDRGYSDGHKQAFEEAEEEVNNMLLEAEQIKMENINQRNSIYQNAEQELLKLSLSIVEKILDREIIKDEYIESLIGNGLKKLVSATNVVVRVSSEDFEFANYIRPRLFAKSDGIDNIEIKEDLSMNRGECVLESSTGGNIDIGIQSQLKKIKEEFENYLRVE